jgi:hypothetical protein
VPAPLEIPQVLSAALHRQLSDRVYVPAAGEVEVLVPRPDALGEGVVELRGAVDFLSIGVDVAYVMFQLLGLEGADAAAYYDCTLSVVKSVSEASADEEIAGAIVDSARSCAERFPLGQERALRLLKLATALQIWDYAGTTGDLTADSAFDLAIVSLRLEAGGFPLRTLTADTPIGLRGIGPIEAGMTLAEAERATGLEFEVREFDTFERRCYFAHPIGLADDLTLLLEAPGPDPVTDADEGVIQRGARDHQRLRMTAVVDHTQAEAPIPRILPARQQRGVAVLDHSYLVEPRGQGAGAGRRIAAVAEQVLNHVAQPRHRGVERRQVVDRCHRLPALDTGGDRRPRAQLRVEVDKLRGRASHRQPDRERALDLAGGEDLDRAREG